MRERVNEFHEIKGRVFRLFIDHFCMKENIPLKRLMRSVERGIIVRILSRVNGNQKEAAKLLGVKYTTLNEKIKKYDIHV